MTTVRERRLGGERGQALVLSVVFLTALLAMAGAVVDVGAWYWQDRKVQVTADAAALAGAQGLQNGTAVSLAKQYGDLNGGGVANSDVTISAPGASTKTVTVKAQRPAPTFFTRLFGVTSVNVKAQATARAGIPVKARWAAPIAVDKRHPLLSGPGCPCFNVATDLDLQKVGPGAFRLINLDNSFGGTGPSKVSDWILNGYDGYMPLDWYFSDSGAKFNSSQIKNAMQVRVGSVMLFPIYTDTRAQGSNFQYFVVGWAGFRVTGFDAQGNGGKVYGHFESVLWEGILSESDSGEDDFGVRSIELVS
jgi:Flp pilus assembly protein TadG